MFELKVLILFKTHPIRELRRIKTRVLFEGTHFKLAAVYGPTASAVLLEEVASLDHKVLDHPIPTRTSNLFRDVSTGRRRKVKREERRTDGRWMICSLEGDC